MESQKVEALLDALEFAEIDLLNPDSKRAFSERLLRAKRRDDRRRRWAQGRMATVWAILGTVGGGIFTFEFPRIAAWLKLP